MLDPRVGHGACQGVVAIYWLGSGVRVGRCVGGCGAGYVEGYVEAMIPRPRA